MPTREQTDRGFEDCAFALAADSRIDKVHAAALHTQIYWLEHAVACRRSPSVTSCTETVLRHPRYRALTQSAAALLGLGGIALIVLALRRGIRWSPTRRPAAAGTAAALSSPVAVSLESPPAAPSPSSLPASEAVAAVPMRDPERARQALRLAFAYLQELDDVSARDMADPDIAPHHRSTLALASEQLDAAQRADPTADFTTSTDKDPPVTFSQPMLRAHALTLEAQTWSGENAGRAIRLATQATEADPQHAAAWHLLGLMHFGERNRARAVAALERALTLEPDNIEYLKLLDRAKHIGGAEVATYKLTKAGATAVAAGIKAWNVAQIIAACAVLLLIVVFFASTARPSCPTSRSSTRTRRPSSATTSSRPATRPRNRRSCSASMACCACRPSTACSAPPRTGSISTRPCRTARSCSSTPARRCSATTPPRCSAATPSHSACAPPSSAPALRPVVIANTSIKLCAGLSDHDARLMARDMRASPELLLSLRKTEHASEFACYLRNETPRALKVSVPFAVLERAEQMSEAAYRSLRERNRSRVAGAPVPREARPTSPHDSETSPPPPSLPDAVEARQRCSTDLDPTVLSDRW